MLEKLNAKQIKAARMLAGGSRTKDITSALEIHEETFYRWKKIKEFRELVENIIAEEIIETRWRAASLIDTSYQTIHNLMRNSYTTDGARLKAALSVLKLAGIDRISVSNVMEPAENETPENEMKAHQDPPLPQPTE